MVYLVFSWLNLGEHQCLGGMKDLVALCDTFEEALDTFNKNSCKYTVGHIQDSMVK